MYLLFLIFLQLKRNVQIFEYVQSVMFFGIFKIRTRVLYQLIKLEAQPRVLGGDKAPNASLKKRPIL